VREQAGRRAAAAALVAVSVVVLGVTMAAWSIGGAGPAPVASTGLEQDTASASTSTSQDASQATLPDPVVLEIDSPARRVIHAEFEGIVESVDIPSVALSAYQRAATIINNADPGCRLDWSLVAAIGYVESNHGHHSGSQLDEDGVARPAIRGLRLDGSGDTQRIKDTDAGQYDDDRQFDRAVGPMQIIPSTWSVIGVDADGDDVRNPQDIDDAALAGAVYLCFGALDLSTDADRQVAVFRYNPDEGYVAMVLRIADAYADADMSFVEIIGVLNNPTLDVGSTPVVLARERTRDEEAGPSPGLMPTVYPPGGGSSGSGPAPTPTAPPTTTRPTSEPPSTPPPTSAPPATEPPTSDPPTSEPPTSGPPTSEPPTSEPPASEPPSESPTSGSATPTAVP
jgi:membrane-bound lytic murein transglycosylase B